MKEELIGLGAVVNAAGYDMAFLHAKKLFHFLTKPFADISFGHDVWNERKSFRITQKIISAQSSAILRRTVTVSTLLSVENIVTVHLWVGEKVSCPLLRLEHNGVRRGVFQSKSIFISQQGT